VVKGDGVLRGSVNGAAAVRFTATASAANSQYCRIVPLVQDAAARRAPVVRPAGRYAIPFTAVALLLGALAWLLSGEALRFAEVLVVATPCPLLIAAPVAFLGGMSRAARNGIIIKNGGTLEQLARVRTAVFDKTGTLTHGSPTLTNTPLMALPPKCRATGLLSESGILWPGAVVPLVRRPSPAASWRSMSVLTTPMPALSS